VDVACARCGAVVSIDDAPTLLRSVFCASCVAVPEVSSFVADEANWHAHEVQRANAARRRFESRRQRLIREEQQRLSRLAERSIAASESAVLPDHIQLAMQRARQRNQKPAEP
jgi:Na+-translocating ferredoxin:NAD+ oxidoreductase RnfC subunit